jgi:hypothetical protein
LIFLIEEITNKQTKITMEFVKFTFPTKEDIGTALYDSVAVAMGALTEAPLPDAPLTEEHVSSLYEMGQGMVNAFMQMPVPTLIPQMGKIPLEEWSASHQTITLEEWSASQQTLDEDP